ncbi:Small subunit processome component 20 like protein [Fukomys damarensis]|uniref:Small subunit processome component 20 like protein n=1 Tax=Fukomys damarensis TaxID=885580 RepID=A0A091DDT8_FUKDA|nr:Small subunit processome component 20 like protein [Fukomys damarensis]
MKIKPVSHKTENTYRFLTFAERLGNVNIDIIHRIDRTASYDEYGGESETGVKIASYRLLYKLEMIPTVSLVVQLARDLQTDFYPHFPDFFLAITSLLETQDTELLEWAFTALSYLYKYLWRLMVKDMASIYRACSLAAGSPVQSAVPWACLVSVDLTSSHQAFA